MWSFGSASNLRQNNCLVASWIKIPAQDPCKHVGSKWAAGHCNVTSLLAGITSPQLRRGVPCEIGSIAYGRDEPSNMQWQTKQAAK